MAACIARPPAIRPRLVGPSVQRSYRSPAPRPRAIVIRATAEAECELLLTRFQNHLLDTEQGKKMVKIVERYLNEFITDGNLDAGSRLLEPHAQHRDMVRHIDYTGVSQIQAYVAELKMQYPDLEVHPMKVSVADSTSVFVAFEGRSADGAPIFKGVDLFQFNLDCSKIQEIQVYRSTLEGMAGHETRNARAASAAARARMRGGPDRPAPAGARAHNGVALNGVARAAAPAERGFGVQNSGEMDDVAEAGASPAPDFYDADGGSAAREQHYRFGGGSF